LFKACKSADLVYSAAFANRDMAAWIAAYSQVDPNELARASTEIAEILEELHKRDKVPTSAIIDRAIIDNGHCTVTALSPNDRRIESFRQSIVGQLPTVGQPRRRAAVLTPNQACVALLVESKAMAGILGADLEETPGRAWTRVIGNSIAYKQAKPAILIKVPHHGSINAHCEEIWNRMEQPPIALLATFNKGEKLPSKADVARIEGKTPHAYACSAYNRVTALKSHDSDKVLKMMQVKRTRRFASMGHIRVRFSDNGEPTVNLYGGAVPLAKVY
jgi:hypothetical protein